MAVAWKQAPLDRDFLVDTPLYYLPSWTPCLATVVGPAEYPKQMLRKSALWWVAAAAGSSSGASKVVGLTHHDLVPELAAKGFHCQLPWKVAWRDMDSFNHVNNAVFIMYLEHARIEYVTRMGIALDAHLQSSSSSSSGGEKDDGEGKLPSLILASVSCRYRRPLTFPDDIVIGTRTTRVDAAKGDFDLEHAVWSRSLNAIAATGTSGCVAFDYDTQKRAAIPDRWLARIKEIDQKH